MNTCYNTVDFKVLDRKKLRKVSKYRDYNHKIAKEKTECLHWAENIENKKKYLKRVCKRELVRYFETLDGDKYIHKIYDTKNGRYTKCMTESVFKENKFHLDKIFKDKDVCYFDKYDVYKFMLVLIYVIERNKLEQFIDIPDVFYIIRQLKQTNLKFYFENLNE